MIKRELILYRTDQKRDEFFFYKFYDKVKELAALHGKRIILTDPMHNVDDRAKEAIAHGADRKKEGWLPSLEPSNREEKVREGVMYSGLVALAAGAILTKLASKADSLKMSRRGFLGLAGAGAAVAAIGGASVLAEKTEEEAWNSGTRPGRPDHPLGAFRYNAATDYREATVGLAIQRADELLREEGREGAIAVFFGKVHIRSIEHYAKAPVEARARLRLYPHQLAYAEPTLTMYEFDDAKGNWVLKKKESLLNV